MNVYPMSLRTLRVWAPSHRHQAVAIAMGILMQVAGGPSPFPVESQVTRSKHFCKCFPQQFPSSEPALSERLKPRRES